MSNLSKIMPGITSAVLAIFVGFIGMWYFDKIEANFSLVLLIASVVTGVYWLLEKFIFLPERQKAVKNVEEQSAARQAELAKMGIQKTEVHAKEMEDAKDGLLMQPWWLDWTAGLFPVIAIVFILRSFLFEPFKIPTGSMIPTLMVGDLILVNKFTYGIRLPVINKKIIAINEPQRGDVMVFRYPPKPTVDYIKRIIGVPGDEVSYLNKKLMINGKPVAKEFVKEFRDPETFRYNNNKFTEIIDSQDGKPRKIEILNDDSRPAMIPGVDDYMGKSNCRYSVEGVVCKVPEGSYFMMGDNRDNSLDSRYWGFVPEQNIVGKAFFVWMNFGDLGRIGSFE